MGVKLNTYIIELLDCGFFNIFAYDFIVCRSSKRTILSFVGKNKLCICTINANYVLKVKHYKNILSDEVIIDYIRG